MSHTFNPTILREYDIRGIVGDTLNEADAYALGRTYAAIARVHPDAGGSAELAVRVNAARDALVAEMNRHTPRAS